MPSAGLAALEVEQETVHKGEDTGSGLRVPRACSLFLFFYFFKYLFIYLFEREHEHGERERERESPADSLLSTELDEGLNPGTLRS